MNFGPDIRGGLRKKKTGKEGVSDHHQRKRHRPYSGVLG